MLACLAGASGPAGAVPSLAPPLDQAPHAVQDAPVLQQFRVLLARQVPLRGRAVATSPRRGNPAHSNTTKITKTTNSTNSTNSTDKTNGAKAVKAVRDPKTVKARKGRQKPRPGPLPPAPQIFTGQAFDTCTAPSLGALQAWRHSSPYGAVGIYIGGRNRACSQPRLNPDWVRSATVLGWGLLPLYVGSQAPCLAPRSGTRIDPRHAVTTGTSEGRDAVRAASALGLAPSSPLYLDMEAYNRDGAGCTLAVLQYTAAWSQAVRAAGYLSGFYSSADAGIADLAAAALHRSAGAPPPPDVIWYARWDSRAATDGYHVLPPGEWADHRRVHQYQGNATERHGGVTLCIDRNAVDAPVAVLAPTGVGAQRR